MAVVGVAVVGVVVVGVAVVGVVVESSCRHVQLSLGFLLVTSSVIPECRRSP